MRKIIFGFGCLCLLLITLPGIAQKMTWTTKSDAARDLAISGAHHLMNVEFPLAYNDLSQALKLDPDFTDALVLMSNLNYGQTRKDFAERAMKSAADKTEGEKMFASLLDTSLKQAQRQDIWAKLHTMFPDGAFIGHIYVISRSDKDESFNAAQEYIKKFPDEPGMYNIIAYYYLQNKKDTAMAKQYFEKYLSLYPDGCNPYDSMGEFYLDTGDTANAKKYYRMALEKYPFYNSALNALQKINAEQKK